jgi:16S rRNA (guanine966-N2)-methyltransferase
VRIVKGKYAGRSLASPGKRVRPTPEAIRDRALEIVGDNLAGARVLDLFAARYVDFVENGGAALHSLKANIATFRESRRTRIYKRDAIPWVEALEQGAYDIAYADPPYGSRKLDRVLAHWLAVPFAGVLLLEHDKEHVIDGKAKQYDFEGPTRLSVLRAGDQLRTDVHPARSVPATETGDSHDIVP